MSETASRQEQEAGVWLPHVRPINELVKHLSEPDGVGWMPYVAPLHGGIRAEVLSVLRDPGPMTNPQQHGSGFLCVENDDDTAERLMTLWAEAGIEPGSVTPWNAYPWYINRRPQAAEIDAGVEPLRRLLALLGNLRVVVLHGGEARQSWRKFVRRHRAEVPDVPVVMTYHTSRQAFIGTAEVRAARLDHLGLSLRTAAAQLVAQR